MVINGIVIKTPPYLINKKTKLKKLLLIALLIVGGDTFTEAEDKGCAN